MGGIYLDLYEDYPFHERKQGNIASRTTVFVLLKRHDVGLMGGLVVRRVGTHAEYFERIGTVEDTDMIFTKAALKPMTMTLI